MSTTSFGGGGTNIGNIVSGGISGGVVAAALPFTSTRMNWLLYLALVLLLVILGSLVAAKITKYLQKRYA